MDHLHSAHAELQQHLGLVSLLSEDIKRMEVCFLVQLVILWVLLFTSSAAVVIAQTASRCWECHLHEISRCPISACKYYEEWVGIQYIFLAALGFLELLVKVVIGILLFRDLKIQLHFYFEQRK